MKLISPFDTIFPVVLDPNLHTLEGEDLEERHFVARRFSHPGMSDSPFADFALPVTFASFTAKV